MNMLAANLKHTYQRRGLWFIYGFGAILAVQLAYVALYRPAPDQGRFLGLICSAVFIGMLAASMQVELLTLPFVFVLPRHRTVIRRFLFIIGVIVNVPAAFLFAFYPAVSSLVQLFAVIAAAMAGLAGYWLGAGVVLLSRNSAVFVGTLPLIVGLGGLTGLHVAVERAIVHQPLLVSLFGLAVNLLMWFLLGYDRLLKSYCGKSWLGFMDAFKHRSSDETCRAAVRWERLGTTPVRLERWFLNRLKALRPAGTARCIWAQIYEMIGLISAQSGSGYAILFAIPVLLGFMALGPDAAVILFFFPAVIVGQARLPVFSNLLITGGRAQRFWSTLTLVALYSAILTILLAAAAAMTIPLERIFPDVTIQGRTFYFRAISLHLWYVPIMMIPAVSTCHILFPRTPVAIVASMVFFMFGIFLVYSVWHRMSSYSFSSLIPVTWTIFLIALAWICRRRPLTSE